MSQRPRRGEGSWRGRLDDIADRTGYSVDWSVQRGWGRLVSAGTLEPECGGGRSPVAVGCCVCEERWLHRSSGSSDGGSDRLWLVEVGCCRLPIGEHQRGRVYCRYLKAAQPGGRSCSTCCEHPAEVPLDGLVCDQVVRRNHPVERVRSGLSVRQAMSTCMRR